MSSIERWLTGITVLAVVATVVASPYSSGIITAGGNAIGNIYQKAKK